jgi:hypothetical protein
MEININSDHKLIVRLLCCSETKQVNWKTWNVLAGRNVELLVLGPFEVLRTELHQEGAHMDPLLRGDPMEPADPNWDHSLMKLADLIRGDEISHVWISVAGGVGAEEGAHRSMMMLPLELVKSTARIIFLGLVRRRPSSQFVLAVPEEEGARRWHTSCGINMREKY